MRTARLIVVGLVVAVIAAVVAHYLQPGAFSLALGPGKPTAEVIVAARDLPAGHRLAEPDLAREPLTAASEASGGYTMTSAIVGRALTVPMQKGQLIREQDLAARGSGAAIASQLPPGQRAIAVTLRDTGANVVLYPGAFVDVLATMDRPTKAGGGRDPVTRTVLERARVLAVNQEAIGTRPAVEEAPRRGSASSATLKRLTVTLAVTPEQAAQLELASARGVIGVCLRSDQDGAGPVMGTTFATTESVLGPDAMPDPPEHSDKPAAVVAVVPEAAPAPAAEPQTGTDADPEQTMDGPEPAPERQRPVPTGAPKPRVWEVIVVRNDGTKKHTFPQPDAPAKGTGP